MTGKGKKTPSGTNADKSKKQQVTSSVKGKAIPAKVVNYYYSILALLLILVITFIAYIPVLRNGFVNWDDDKYIQNNPLIYSINLKDIFSQYATSNYHPLTMLTYAIEYHFFGLNETGYHAVNLLLHLLNVILVFYVILQLSNKTEVALIVSLFFGVHPLHVESVAWASELKDLLYTFFFIAGYICYIKYLRDSKKRFYVFALLLFLLSVLSKAMAVSLPAVFILTDYFKGRKMNARVWIEKIPFVFLGVVFGIVAIFAQKSTGAIQDQAVFPFYQRLVYACYGFITYLEKLIVPHHLSAYYPYPVINGEAVPAIYYVCPVIFLAFVTLVIYSIRYTGKIAFGIGFFTLTVFLVLQLLPVGGAIISDRYSYIPSIGIFYIGGEGFYWLWHNSKVALVYKRLTAAALSLLIILFSVNTYARCEVWKNGITLWNDVISKYQTIAPVYNNRGILLLDKKKYDEALNDFNKAIELQPEYALAYNDRGTLLMQKERYDEAFKDFNSAIRFQTDFPEAYTNRGIVFTNQKKYDEALNDFNKAIEIQNNYANTYYHRGFLFANQNKFAEAVSDYGKFIELQPNNNAEAYYNKAICEYNIGRKDDACSDLQIAIDNGWEHAVDAKRDLCY